MLRIFVDSGSSIKQDETDRYGVEILPLHIALGGKDYLDSSDGGVKVLSKARGLKRAMQALAKYLDTCACDPNYPIVPSYTYNSANLDALIALTDEKYHRQMVAYDNLDPAIACHWGPNAFGYIFVAGNGNR